MLAFISHWIQMAFLLDPSSLLVEYRGTGLETKYLLILEPDLPGCYGPRIFFQWIIRFFEVAIEIFVSRLEHFMNMNLV